MNSRLILRFTLAAAAGVLLVCGSRVVRGQNLLESGMTMGIEGMAGAGETADGGQYALGTKAINESRWSDAIGIFGKIAAEHGDRSAGALYWKAYAENKQGQGSNALQTCVELRQTYAGSSWIDECGALEIEIRARSGQPVQPKPDQSDDVKLLALNSLMQHNEAKARAQIEDIINSDSSERLKEGALFILGDSAADVNYPQIVRISYLEGDVRIARGESKHDTWEKAESGLPLETGFSLVTGAGRAEIELEDASTLYLGENSVLTLNDLHTTGGVPHTEVALLSGTLTMHLDSLMPGEWMMLRTPTDNILTRYPAKSDLRINSYMDATGITLLRSGSLRLPGSSLQPLNEGETLFYRDGRRVDDLKPVETSYLAAWDQWVKTRYDARTAAMNAVMKDAGLSAPIPGLADMKDKGTFFDCAPYGTCWEPAALDETQQPIEAGDALASPQSPSQKKQIVIPSAYAGYDMFPCLPSNFRYRYQTTYSNGVDPYAMPYDWALCHAGSWIMHGRRYAWVVGHRRHHHDPIHWVKNGRQVAYVPIHPRDVKGHPPLNREHGFVALRDNKTVTIKPTVFDPVRPVEILKSPPREFRNESMPNLAHVDAPHMEAHAIKDPGPGKGPVARSGGIPLTFDHKTQSFMMPMHTMQGNRTVTSLAPINNHGGNLQARGGSSGGMSGGGSHGGGASGGGSHGGGGSSGSSGGGSHGGGGSSGSSGGGSSGASSASGGGGGSHH
jgi:hypothetical protein